MFCKLLVTTCPLTLEDKMKCWQVRANHLAVLGTLTLTLSPNLCCINNDSTSNPKALLLGDNHSNFKWLVFNSQILEHLKQRNKLYLTSERKVTTEKHLNLFLKL